MKFFGYETFEKLVWTSGECNKITDKISKQVIPENHTNKIPPSSKLGFGFSPNKETCDILSEDLVSSIFQAHYYKK